MYKQLFCVLFIAGVSVVLLSANPASGGTLLRNERSVTEKTENKNETEPAICEGPCGWAVYSRFTRHVEYFLKNPYCGCPKERPCLKSSDDLSTSAYIYTCRPRNKDVDSIP